MDLSIFGGEIRKYRMKDGAWKRVKWFPQVKLSIVSVDSIWYHVWRHDGKHFPTVDPEAGIKEALDDWAKDRLRLAGDLPS